jgi:RNA polymerase sigma-70 factor (ECF subfamily)
VHCARASSGTTDWGALRTLYAALATVAPTLAPWSRWRPPSAAWRGPDRGLAALDAIADPAALRFQPAWATRAHLLAEAGRVEEAEQAYGKAISLTTEPAVRRYLESRRRGLR